MLLWTVSVLCLQRDRVTGSCVTPDCVCFMFAERSCDGFMCYSGQCLPRSLQQDGFTDCPGFYLEDEVMDTASK